VTEIISKENFEKFFHFMIMFALCFAMGKAHVWETFPKCRARLTYSLV
jgi:hypothetical protein